MIHTGDALEIMRGMDAESVHVCVTSPPYFGLRDYSHAGQLGLEKTPDAYVTRLVEVFREVKRVLRRDGTLWLNLGDSYAAGRVGRGDQGRTKLDGYERKQAGPQARRYAPPGVKPKDLIGIPWLTAFALRADGWYLRQEIIWAKPNPMPSSATDRCTRAHEQIFMLSKSPRYYYDAAAIRTPLKASSVARLGQDVAGQKGSSRVPGKTNGNMKAVCFGGVKGGGDFGSAARLKNGNAADPGDEPGANKKSVWTVTTKPFKEAHFATYPPDLIIPCILAGSPVGGVVLDPFMGAGTTALVAQRSGRRWIGCELNPGYVEIARRRLSADAGKWAASL